MNTQPVVAATVGIVLATMLLSGPLLSVVDLTSEPSFSGAELGEGRATIGTVTFPDSAAFERGDFGSGSYYLRVPPVSVDVREVIGRPILSYEISIPELGYEASTIAVLSASSAGTRTLSIEDDAFGRNEIANERYAARLVVDVRYGGTERVVASRNVTVEVVR